MSQEPYGKFTWRITEFTSRQSERICSDVFPVGGYNWKVTVYPKGNNNQDHLSMFLKIADSDSLPTGCSINVKYSLTVVNQFQTDDSIKKEVDRHEFTFQEHGWGFTSFISLTELHDSSKGYLVNNTLVVEAEVLIPDRVDTFFSNLEKLISDAVDQGQNSAPKARSSLTCLKSEVPSLEEVELAKKSLKECLSDLFKLNMTDRLSTSLETLSRAKIGLSSEQQEAIQLFCTEFDDFVLDFLSFEQDNSEFELQKIKRDQMFSSIKQNHKTYISNKQLIADLTKEEEEHKKRMEEAKSKKVKLMSDSEALTASSVETKTKYTAQLKKVEEAEEKKRIAEERMSRSTSAWSSLKTHFV